jgi:hypothetical protein
MRTRLNDGTVAAALLVLLGALALAACSSDDPDRDPGTGGSGNTGNTGNHGGSGATGNTGGTGATGNQGGTGNTGNTGNYGGSLPEDATIMFLHHSTGGVIWGGGVETALQALNAADSTSYAITALDYPDGDVYPWQNYPYDYWYLWVDANGHAGDYAPNPTIEDLTSTYNLVVFKHCFPVSDIQADDGSPDITSSYETIANYKLQYAAIKERLHGFPNNRFIVWTGAAEVAAASNDDQGARSREFFTWVKTEWDEPGDNIFVFDFFELETEGGNFLLDQYSEDPVGANSHPNAAFAATVAPYFAQRMVDVIEGRGDTGSLTGH